jgi:hypothetical protein
MFGRREDRGRLARLRAASPARRQPNRARLIPSQKRVEPR